MDIDADVRVDDLRELSDGTLIWTGASPFPAYGEIWKNGELTGVAAEVDGSPSITEVTADYPDMTTEDSGYREKTLTPENVPSLYAGGPGDRPVPMEGAQVEAFEVP